MTRWSRMIPRAVAAAATLVGADRAAVAQVSPAPEPPPAEGTIVPAAEAASGELPPIEPLVLGQSGATAGQPTTMQGPQTPAAQGGAAPPAGGGAADGCDACGGFDFKKVPPVRVFPRPGYFPIPPSGKGYYSALDALRGECRDGPPKFGYPPFALMPPSFFDADFRYLDDPKTPPQNVLDRMKRIRLGDDWLLSLGGQSWTRYHNEYNSRLGQRDNVYELWRARAYADLWYRDVFRVYVEGNYTDTYWQDLAPLAIDRSRGDFQNLFIDVKAGTVGGAPVYVRVGRQELLFGSQRLVSPPDWANTRRTFNGVRAFRATEKFDVDLFWAQPVVPNPQALDSVDNNQNFAGAWATYRPKKGTFVDLYYLMLDNTSRVAQQGINRAPFTTHTIGTRYAGDVDNEFLWDAELAVQLGKQGRQDIIAGMGTVGVGYHSKCLPWNPTVWGYYDYASGDENPNVGTLNTFNQLFPFGHYYLGWTDLIGRQNIHDLNYHLYLYPAKWVTLNVQYHLFWLDRPQDALYSIAGTAYRRDPTGRSGRFVGQEVDAITNFHLTPRADLLVSYAYLFGGDFLRRTRTATQASDASVFAVMYSVRW